MEAIDVKVKKWGNSLGIILPKDLLDNSEIKEGTKIEIFIRPKNKTKVKDLFGILKGKLKKNTDKLMQEVDRDLWKIEK